MYKNIVFIICLIGVLSLIPSTSFANDLDNWYSRNSVPLRFSVNGVAYGNSTFVAAQYYGRIATSPDGIHWIVRNSGATDNLFGVAYGNGTFVAVGDEGTIITSTDGKTWATRTSGTNEHLAAVTYGNGMFVVMGFDQTESLSPRFNLISRDGVNWTLGNSGVNGVALDVTYGNSTFVAVGSSDGYSTAWTSPDGLNWVGRKSGSDWGLNGVAYGNGIFVAVGYSGTILTSADGKNWTPRSSGLPSYSAGFVKVTYSNGIFVAVGEDGAIETSPDGLNWTIRNSGTTGHLNAVAYGNSTFVAVGDKGYARDIGTAVTSPDGVNWTERNSGNDWDLTAGTYGKNTFVAVGSEGVIVTSPDGVNWTERSSGTTDNLFGVAYGNGTFVAVGDDGSIVTSPDGVSWTERSSGTADNLFGVAYGNGTFVAVGSGGLTIIGYPSLYTYSTILSSKNGLNWTVTSSQIYKPLFGVNYGNGTFIAIGAGSIESWWGPGLIYVYYADSLILTSKNGLNWTDERISSFDPLTGAAYGNDTFVAVGDDRLPDHAPPYAADAGTVATSPDGVNWTERSSGTTENLTGVVYGNGTFVAVGDKGMIITSPDGVNWTKRSSGTTEDLPGAAYGNGTFIAVGKHGTILQSGSSAPPYTVLPLIKANGVDEQYMPVTVFTDETLSIDVTLLYEGATGLNADWWVAAYAPFGWYSFTLDNGWMPGLVPSYQGPLFDLNSYHVLTITGLPEGDYFFYFGVDTNMNGVLDTDKLYYSYVPVTIKKR